MVTATDERLFQAPLHAGIALESHQLVPLQRALELPRANLFIAGDVGLGKTSEAGLVLSELDFVVANPPFSTKAWSNGFDPTNDLFKRFQLGDRTLIPPQKNGDYAFLLHVRIPLAFDHRFRRHPIGRSDNIRSAIPTIRSPVPTT